MSLSGNFNASSVLLLPASAMSWTSMDAGAKNIDASQNKQPSINKRDLTQIPPGTCIGICNLPPKNDDSGHQVK